MAKNNTKVGHKIVFRPDSKHTDTLVKAAKKSVRNAVKVSKAMGLSITYLKGNKIIKEDPSGETRIVTEMKNVSNDDLMFDVGTILYAKK